jgi:hypothetical protein
LKHIGEICSVCSEHKLLPSFSETPRQGSLIIRVTDVKRRVITGVFCPGCGAGFPAADHGLSVEQVRERQLPTLQNPPKRPPNCRHCGTTALRTSRFVDRRGGWITYAYCPNCGPAGIGLIVWTDAPHDAEKAPAHGAHGSGRKTR